MASSFIIARALARRAIHFWWALWFGHQREDVSLNGRPIYVACSCGRVFYKDEVTLARLRARQP